ncbi:MAG: hypothetical protein AB7S59_24535 [Parvibaculaceae bacterium]
MIKMMMAAAGLSLGLLMMPVATAPAQAGVDIDINIGGKKRISCQRGRRIVEDYGFRRVSARDCSGSNYTSIGSRRGDRFRITLDSRRGRIVDVRRFW